MKKHGIGIIGLGVGRHHLEAYLSNSRCDVRFLCDFSEEKLNTGRKMCPTAKITKDAAEVLSAEDVDIVSIASRDCDHADQIVGAIKNGKHVFSEKPLCLTVAELDQISCLLKENPTLQLSANLNLRTCPRFQSVRAAVASGQMGKVFCMKGHYLWGRSEKLTSGWRREMDFYSIILGASIHMIDLITWVIRQKPVSVCGYGNNIATRDAGFPWHDHASVVFQFGDGMVAEVSASAGCVHRHFHSLEIYGTQSTFVQNGSGAYWVESPDGQIRSDITEYPANNRKLEMITTFVDSIGNINVRPLINKEEVMDLMRVCFAAEEAVKSGREIKIEHETSERKK